jgi:hypothetical protein
MWPTVGFLVSCYKIIYQHLNLVVRHLLIFQRETAKCQRSLFTKWAYYTVIDNMVEPY